MGLNSIPLIINPCIGIVTLTAITMWMTFMFFDLQKWKSSNKIRSEILEQLQTLSRGEKEIFIFCLANNQRTIYRSMIDSDLHGLVSKKLLVKASGQGDAIAWPYTNPTFVWTHLKKNEVFLFTELFDESDMGVLPADVQGNGKIFGRNLVARKCQILLKKAKHGESNKKGKSLISLEKSLN